ncbi:MAG: vWA domain-containing protein, partial [bacterium]
MSLREPVALWGLLILPLIVLLYMLRTRRQDVPVTTLILWQRARRDLAAQRPARRLERSLLLLLQLLAAALIVLALAKPQLSLSGGQTPTAVIIDTSASMQATDEPPSRFATAIRLAQEVVASAKGSIMIIDAGPRPQIVLPFSEPGAARAALDRMRPTDGPGRLDQALTVALGQRVGGVRPRVEVFTDRAGDAMPGVVYHVLGSSSQNVGVFGVNVERDAGGSVLIIQVQNAGDRPER